jgi:alpha-beta hydrolase superfamily lysophospholipase
MLQWVGVLSIGIGLFCTGCQVQPPIPLDDIFLRPTESLVGTPAEYGYEYESLILPIGGSRAISVWHVKAADPKGIVVIIPGSDRNKSRYLIGLPVFIPHGYDVILMDYEGFGESPGAHTLQNLVDDGFAAIEYAQSKNARVIAFGISTGAPTAIRAATEKDLAAVILEAPLILADETEFYLRFIGIDVPALWNIANLYVDPQIPPDFDILRYAAEVEEPKLIMCSVDDDVVTYESGVRVFNAAAEPKVFWEMQGKHGEMIEVDFDAYQKKIIGWLDATLGVPPRP